MSFPLRTFLTFLLIGCIGEVRGTAVDDQTEDLTPWRISGYIKEYYEDVSKRSLFTVEVFLKGKPVEKIQNTFSFDETLAKMEDLQLALEVSLQDMHDLRKTIQKRDPFSEDYDGYVQRVLATTPYKTSKDLRDARFRTECRKYSAIKKIKRAQNKRNNVIERFISPLLTSEKVLEFIITKNPQWAEEQQKTTALKFIKEILGD